MGKVPSQRYRYKDIYINYLDHGSGTPILLLHGFGASSYSWRHVTAHFSANYRVLSIDLKGFGLSDRPADFNYSLKEQGNIVTEFIRDKQLENTTLIGHSLGGAVALVVYLTMQDIWRNAIQRLILIDSVSYPQHFPFFIQLLRTPVLNRLAFALLPNKMMTRLILKTAFFDDSKITEEMVKIYGSYVGLKGSPHALSTTAQQIIPEDMNRIIDKYKSIKAPVLVIWGGNDTIIPLSIGEKLAGEIANAQFKVIERCGHVPQEECPEQTLRSIDAFLRDSR